MISPGLQAFVPALGLQAFVPAPLITHHPSLKTK